MSNLPLPDPSYRIVILWRDVVSTLSVVVSLSVVVVASVDVVVVHSVATVEFSSSLLSCSELVVVFLVVPNVDTGSLLPSSSDDSCSELFSSELAVFSVVIVLVPARSKMKSES